ncbi:acylphosphatase [uncultured Faecalicoccus sp.]|uniref:acylphosphatase n=1 Tax=uncultured Faecalicoccus sp. TaxID=1971760 RepID=UPI0025DDC832|nr:acylphosphatase [uncultured Faecalicoccus sp.]
MRFFEPNSQSMESSSSNTVRKQIQFTGTVQGVGFRYLVQQLARHYHISGWVQNQWDGSVIAQLQGPPENINKLIEKLYEDRYIQIDEIKQKTLPTQIEAGFQVRY